MEPGVHQGLAATEIAFCTVLLVSAILLAESLVRVAGECLGERIARADAELLRAVQPLPGRFTASAAPYKGDRASA